MATRIDRPNQRYSNVAIALHWVIAALILFNLYTGFFGGPAFAFHVSSGITILVLSVVRVGWRLTHRRPPYPQEMKAWERALAHANHFLLYVAMLIIPFSGWALVSASPPAGSPGLTAANAERAAEGKAPRDGRGPTIWGTFTLPKIAAVSEVGREPAGLAEQRAVHDRIETFHGTAAWLLLALFVLHVAGALKHQLVDRRREMARMGIGRP
jgi:cytochrome b561